MLPLGSEAFSSENSFSCRYNMGGFATYALGNEGLRPLPRDDAPHTPTACA